MSGKNIPVLYAMSMLAAFYATTVFGDICNTDYEGQIKNQGDEVIVRLVPEIEIHDYVRGQKLIYDTPEASTRSLLIDKGKSFQHSINDVDELQADVKYREAWSADGAMRLKGSTDTTILSDVYSDAHASNAGATAGAISAGFNLGVAGTPLVVTKSNILDVIVDCGTVLDEQNVPEDNRFLILPAKYCGSIKKSDLANASISGDGTSIRRNGRLGEIDRFTLYSSNNISTVTDTTRCSHAIFGHKSAITFAAQMNKSETLKNPDDFGDLFRALMIYGYKVMRPEALGHLYISAT